jgi:sterol desaturase/sphingolipid hydroxylase (fatty acid hydroxylase superfamily)
LFSTYLDAVKDHLHAWLSGDFPWIEWFAVKSLDMVTEPLADASSRFYWPNILFSLCVAGIAFILYNRSSRGASGDGFLRYCFPKEFFTHPSTIVDYKLFITNHLLGNSANLFWRFNTAFIAGSLVGGLTWVFGPGLHLFHWSFAALLLFTIVWSMTEDLGWYIYHRASHQIPILWAYHKLHHSAEVLTPFVFMRAHPVEFTVMRPIVGLVTGLVLAPLIYLTMDEPQPLTILGVSLSAAAFGAMGHLLHHSHVWVSFGPVVNRILVSPAQHQIHHSTAPEHWDRNFAEHWALWDWIFGTLYLPKGRLKLTFGLMAGMTHAHSTLVAALLTPFLEAAIEGGRLAALIGRRIGSIRPGPKPASGSDLPVFGSKLLALLDRFSVVQNQRTT